MTANDAAIYMRELYEFYINNTTYGNNLMDHFKKANWKLVSYVNNNYNTANKGGWSGTSITMLLLFLMKILTY